MKIDRIEERLSYFKELMLNNNNFYLWVYTMDWELISSNCPFENIVRNFFMLNSVPTIKESGSLHDGSVFYLVDNLYLLWLVLPFITKENTAIYVIGPIFSNSISETLFKKRMDMYHMPIDSQHKMMQLLHSIPVASMMYLMQFGCMLYYTLYGKRISPNDIRPLNNEPPISGDSRSIKRHGTYAYEQLMLADVENGNIDYRKSRSNMETNLLTGQEVGTLCPGNPLRQAMDEIIVHTALVTRAAIRGGLPPDESYSLSDYYIQHIESSDSMEEVYAISATMYDDFIQRVYETKHLPKLSADMYHVLTRINENLFTPLRLEDIAAEIGYTKYYLSAKFKKEMGISINDYITQERVGKAKLALASSDIEIGELSEKLGFSTPSYFTASFRKLTGMTPTEFRNSNLT